MKDTIFGFIWALSMLVIGAAKTNSQDSPKDTVKDSTAVPNVVPAKILKRVQTDLQQQRTIDSLANAIEKKLDNFDVKPEVEAISNDLDYTYNLAKKATLEKAKKRETTPYKVHFSLRAISIIPARPIDTVHIETCPASMPQVETVKPDNENFFERIFRWLK